MKSIQPFTLNKAAIYFFIQFLTVTSLFSQVSISHQAIGGLGQSFSNQSIQVNSSFGLPFSKTISAGTLMLTQGFQQANGCVFAVNAGVDTIRSCGDSVLITADTGFASYNWSNGASTYQTYAKQSGWYSCIASGNCSATDSVFVILLKANILENDTSSCNAGFLTLHLPVNANSNGTSILWSEGGTGTSAQINLNPVVAPVPDNGDDPNDLNSVPLINYPYTKKVWVRLSNGPLVCTDTLRIVIYQPGVLNLSDSVLLVNGQTATIKGDSGFANYSWSNGTFTRNTTSNQSGLLRLNAWNGPGCVSSDSIRIIVLPGIPQDTIKVCGDSLLINAGNQQAAVLWSTTQTSNSIYAKSTGWYKCTYSLGTLSNSDSVFVSLVKAKILASSTRICRGGSVTLTAENLIGGVNSNPNPQVVLQNGLLSYFPFNGNTNDASTNGNDLIVKGDASLTMDRFNSSVSAYNFTTVLNNSRLEYQPSKFNLIDNLTQGTISFWVKVNSFDQTNHYFGYDNMFMARQKHGLNTQAYIGIKSGTNKIRFHLNGGLPNSGDLESNSSLNASVWYHVLYTWDGQQEKVYLNGVIDNSKLSSNSISLMINPDMFCFGSYAGLGSNSTNSVLDDIGIWNRPLNTNEIQHLYSSNQLYCQWSNNSTSSNISVTPTQTTTYTLRISNGISYCDDSITIVVDSIVPPNLADSMLVCGDSILLNAGNYSSYLWSNGSTNQSTYIKTAGWNFVSVTNGLSCSLRDSFYISFTSKPHINITANGSTSICPGSSVNLSSTLLNAYNYTWYRNGNVLSGQVNNSLVASSTGLYKLIVNNGFNCADTSNSIQVNRLQMGSIASSALSHQVYLFKGTTSSNLFTTNNWLIFDSINQQYSNAVSAPQSNSNIVISPIGTCVLNNPVLTNHFECNELYIDSFASLDLGLFKLTVQSKLRTSGVIKSTGGSITINGNSQQSIIRMDTSQNQLVDFVYNLNAGSVIIGSPLRIKQSINPISGTCYSNGNLIMVSNQNGTARILKGTGSYLSDSVVIERFLPGSSGRRNRYLSAPFTSGPSLFNSWQKDMHITGPGTGGTPCPNLGNNANGFDATLTNSSSLFTFSETTAMNTNITGTGGGGTLYTNAWQGLPSTYNTNLQAGKGYRVFYRGNRQQGCDLLNGQNPSPTDAVLRAKGIVQTGTFNFSITYSPNNGEGWNLLGNPYPCPIDWNSNNGWTKQNIMNQIWIFRPAGNHFATWNGALGLGVNFGHNIIESGSAFFVKATASNPVLTINENVKVGTSPPVHLFKNTQKVLRLLVLKPNEVDDEFALVMLPEALNGQDNFDSEKMSNPWLNVYSINSDGKKNGINSIAPIQSEIEIPLGFGSSYSGLHRFSFKGLHEYSNYDVLLWDKFLGVLHAVHDKHTYEFNYSGSQNTETRFLLILVNRGDPDYLKTKEMIYSKSAGSLLISPNPAHDIAAIEAHGLTGEQGSLIVYNTLGLEISKEIIPIKKGNISLTKSIETWASGAYEFVVIDEKGNRKSGRLIKY